MKSALVILTLLQHIFAQSNQICSSSCASYLGPCRNFSYTGCTVCDPTIFNQVPSATGCTPKSQINIESVDLNNAIDLTSFNVSTYATFSCGGFQIAGGFTNGDQVSKTYYISNPHYKMRVSFSITFLGTFSTNDQIFVWIDGEKHAFNYSCQTWTSLCSAKDCVRTISQEVVHKGSTISVAVNGTTTSGTFWGIKDLIVASYGCHPWCSECYGPEKTQCLFCADGYYLEGNVCVKQCSNYTIEQSKFCVSLCPNGQYSNSSNYCSDCYEGCQFCSGPTLKECLMAQVAGPQFYKNIGLNIFIIVLGGVIIGMGIYCWVKRCQKKSEVEVSDSNEIAKRIVHETSQNFIEDNTFNHSHDKSRDVLMNEKQDYRMRKVSVLEEIQL